MDKSRWRRLAPELVLVAAAALVIGASIGYVVGTRATCGSSCKFDVALFEAVGTWVGGVALALAALAFTISQTWIARRERSEHALGLARMCVLRAHAVLEGDQIRRVEFSFKNSTTVPISDVSAHLKGGGTLGSDARVAPDRTWGFSRKPEDLGLPMTAKTREAAGSMVATEVRPNLVFVFTVDGFRFVRNGNQVSPYRDAPMWRSPA